LEQRCARVTYTDPYISALRLNGHSLSSINLEESAVIADCVVIVTDHTTFDYKSLVDNAQLIIDTRRSEILPLPNHHPLVALCHCRLCSHKNQANPHP